MFWFKTENGLPLTVASGQVKVLFGAPGWATPVMGMYDSRRRQWLEYDRQADRYYDFEGPPPTLYIIIPDLP